MLNLGIEGIVENEEVVEEVSDGMWYKTLRQ